MQDAGGIEYTIDVNTTGVIKQVDAVTKANKKAGTSFNELDTQVNKTTQAMSGIGRSAGQAGIQIQQFIGQVQGGQSAMLALSQQSADLGFVLGVPLLGAVMGISASLVGILLPSLFDTKDSAEELEKVMESLDKVITSSQSGVNVLSNEYANLAKQNETLARATALSQIKGIQNGLDSVSESVREAIDGFAGFFGEIDKADFDSLIRYVEESEKGIESLNDSFYARDGLTFAAKAVNELSEQLGISSEEALYLSSSLGKVAQGGGVEAIQEFGGELSDLAAKKGPEASQALVDLQLKVNKLADDSVTLQEKQQILKEILNGVKVASEEQAGAIDALKSKYDSLAKSLEVQADLLGKTQVQQLAYKKQLALTEAAQAGVNEETIKSIEASYDKQIAYAKEQAVIKATREAETKAAAASRKAASSAAAAKREKAAADREAAAANKASIKADVEAFEIMDDLRKQAEEQAAQDRNDLQSASPLAALDMNLQDELSVLQSVYDKKLISEREFQAQKYAINKEYNDSIMELAEERFKAESTNNDLIISSLDSLSSTAENVFSSMLSGTMTAQEAMVSFGNAIVNDVIGSLVQMATQQIKNLILAEAIAALTGGFTSGASYSMGAASSLAAGVTGRATGGPVSASSLYQMGEGNQPEVLQTGSGMFAVPGDSGRVFNRNQLDQIEGAGSSTTNIVVNVSSSGTMTTQGDSDNATLGKEIASVVEAKIKAYEARSMKQGGALWAARKR